MAPSRLYLPSSGTAPASPAYGSVWDTAAQSARLPLVKTKTNTGLSRISVGATTSSAPWDVTARQWISSDTLPAGAIAGNLSVVMRVQESGSDADMMLQLRVAVVSGDGATTRGELYSGQAATTVSATASDNNAEMPSGGTDLTRILQVPLSSVSATAGDRLVVEIGVRSLKLGGSARSAFFNIGDPSATSDHTLTADDSAALVPWIEFDTDIWTASGVDRIVTMAGTVPGVTSAVVLDSEIDVTHAATVPAVSGAFALTIPGAALDLTMAGTVPGVVSSVTVGQVVVGHTETSNRVGGIHVGGYAVATWEPPVVEPPAVIVHGESRDVALAHGPVTMNGTQPEFTVTRAEKVGHRTRIVVGGKDITYFRDKATPLPAYQLVSPLLYGPATLRIPQIAPAFEKIGINELNWLRPGKSVKVQRVNVDGDIVATDYKGVVIAINASGGELSVEIGGEASGRAALMEQPLPIFRTVRDIGRLAFYAIRELELPFKPRLGPVTGIEIARFGGTGHLDYISQLCARAWTRAGNQWTIMPDPSDGIYRMVRKNTTTIDGTAYLDDATTVADLRRDVAEEPNRIYATGVTPEGQRVRFGAYPGLKQGKAAPYPFNDDRNFSAGTTDADTHTGDGITVMVDQLRVFKYVTAKEAPGGYDSDVTEGIRQLQDDAGLPVTGTMTPATWRALYDLDAVGFSLQGARIQPAAQANSTREWFRSASGALVRRNENYQPLALKRDRTVDLGSGFTIAQMREFARAEIAAGNEDNWVGTITFHTGGLVDGNHSPGDPLTDSGVLRARALRPGMNLRLPHGPGGNLTVHVSAVSVDEDGKVTATVDTRARDSMAVWEVIERNRESRRDPARQWIRQHRASSEIKDAIDGWDEVGGLLGAKVAIPARTWTVFEVVAGQEGTVARLRAQTNPNAEFVMAVFGKSIPAKRLARMIGNPLTKKGAKKWADEGVRNKLDASHLLLYVAGDKDQPLGYWPKNKRPDTVTVDEPNPDYNPSADTDDLGTDDEPTIEVEHETGSITPLTGKWQDDAGFGYRTFAKPVLYVAVYADRDTSIPGGRIMWPQLEAGA